MNQQEMLRYSRHFLLPEIGTAGQEKLKKSSVLLVGAGGLGSPMALYLAAAGVGRIGLIDFDQVDLSNLQRQILYGTKDIGKSKVETAKLRLLELNPEIKIETYNEKLTEKNALALFGQYDLIADGADNFSTRYLVNDAAVLAKKPLVSASILGFEGQVSVFHYQNGPCYRCLYPEPPPAGTVPSCAENGVLGVLPGVMGTLQATEVLKILLGIGESLSGYLLCFDALRMDFQKLKIEKNPACALCGKNPSIKTLKEMVPTVCETPSIEEVSCEQVKAWLDANEKIQILDVREDHEVAICRISGSTHIPIGELETRLGELSKTNPIIIHCKGGGRSKRATLRLKELGLNAKNLHGGIMEWITKIDPSQKKY